MNLLATVEKETGSEPDCCVIFLHGLGTSGYDCLSVCESLSLPPHLQLRCVFPHAPSIPVTLNGGIIMPAWYDVSGGDIEKWFDREQLKMSAMVLGKLVEREVERGIESRRIVIAGFSQGGSVAYHFALCSPRPLAGLLVLSSSWITARYCTVHKVNNALPILIQHGQNDPVVSERLAAKSVVELQRRGLCPEYLTYSMGHGLCGQQIEDISVWLQATLMGRRGRP